MASQESSAEIKEKSEGIDKTTDKKSPKKPKGKGNKKKSDKKPTKSKDTKAKKEPDEKSAKKHDKLVKKAKKIKVGEEEELSKSERAKKEDQTKKKVKKSTSSKDIPILKKKQDTPSKEAHTKEKSKASATDSTKSVNADKPEAASVKAKSARKSIGFKKGYKSAKPLKSSKPKDIEQEIREETKEEKDHNKDLLDTVYHKMEIEVDAVDHKVTKEPEPVAEIKYASYDNVAERVIEHVNSLMASLHEIFQLYKPSDVMLSFNGGKDCTVVLHLLHTFYQMNSCLKHIKLPTLYITDPDAFEEVDDFVKDCEKLFNIELIRKPGPIKKALEEICKEKPHIKAVFMGCRRTDPYCQDLKMMQATDPGWPPLMRINPIIDWKCRDVWQYLYMYNVPYCSLYQKGYTSIGNKNDTKPNPYLRIIDNTTGSVVDYRPGHELIDNDELERAGRIKIPKDSSKSVNSQ